MRRLMFAAAIALGLATPALAQGTLRVAIGTTITDPTIRKASQPTLSHIGMA